MNFKQLLKKDKDLAFTSKFPLQDYSDQFDCFVYKNKQMMDILKINSKDLLNLDINTVQYDCLQFLKMYRTYGDDLKIIAMNFPIDTTDQQHYLQTIRERTTNPLYENIIKERLDELERIEHNMTEREYYLMYFGKDGETIVKNRNDIKGILSRNGLVSQISKEKKEKILSKLNNPCSRIELHSEDGIIPPSEEEKEKLGYNPLLIERVQSKGGINFTEDDRAIKTGDGYMSCLYVHEYPETLKMHWLSKVVNINQVVTMIDIETQTDMIEVKKNINRSLGEQKSRYATAKDGTDKMDAENEYLKLKETYDEIANMGEIIKNLRIRLFIPAETYVKLEELVAETKNELDSIGYKCAIGLNEGEYDYLSMFLPYKKQSLYANARNGQPFFSETLAGGNPFHFSSLTDKYGTYYGMSDSTQGAVLWDNFTKTSTRLSYNAIIFGGMGSGKSTLLKKNFKDRIMRGDFVRGFDVSGEWKDLVYQYGGKIISLDGSDGVLNPLEVLKTDESETQSFAQHLGKSTTIYKFLVPDATASELYKYENLLRELYVNHGMITENGTIQNEGKITGLAPEQYPIYEDFITLLNQKLSHDYSDLDSVQKQLKVAELMEMNKMKQVFENLVKNYGKMFNGYTTLPNILDTQIVFFDIRGLAKMTDRIFDAQMFSFLSLCYDNCVKIGSVMKDSYTQWEADHTKGISWENITRFIIYVDEAHRIVNANKLTAVDQLVVYEREARKYFGGIFLASQSIRDFVPEGAESRAIEQIKKLFELSQYKVIMKQDANSITTLGQVFNQELTSEELADVPRFETGQCILCISGDKNIRYHNFITQEEKVMFSGGA